MTDSHFTHTHRVSYAECAIGNHVYYARYLDILEEARGEFFRHLGQTFRELHEAQDSVFPVTEAHVRYRGAARYDDVLRIEVWMNEVARVRLKFGYRILNEAGTRLIEAETVHACASVADKLKPIPDALAEALRRYLGPA
jgi:acyl-CoA thioester hydrolase